MTASGAPSELPQSLQPEAPAVSILEEVHIGEGLVEPHLEKVQALCAAVQPGKESGHHCWNCGGLGCR